MVRPRKAGLFQTDFCLAPEVRTGQERVSRDAAFAFRLRFPRVRSLRLRSGQAGQAGQKRRWVAAFFAEFAFCAVFRLHFWGRKTLPKTFSTAKTVKTAETLDTGRVNLLFGDCRAERSVLPANGRVGAV